MNTQHNIKIFLGSSITELKDERKDLGDYIMNSVRPIFKHDGFEIEVLKCEDIHKGNRGKNPQDEIDDLLRSSDISVFLFKKEAGLKTIHEFDVAREWQKTNLHHEIYVFCSNLPESDRSKELNDFLLRLKQEDFYWHTYPNIEDVKNELTLGLLEYGRILLGKPTNTDALKETTTEENADARFETYQENENKQAQLREQIYQDIEDLLKEIETVKENDDFTIAEKIFKVIELYKKADRCAAATDYDKEKYSDLLFDYARFLYDYGLYKDSEAIWLRQIQLVEKLHGKESKEAAKSFDNTGKVYSKLYDNRNALFYYSKALAIREKILGIDHLDTANSYNNIGDLLCEGNSYGIVLKHIPNLNKSPMLAITEMLKLHPLIVLITLKAINLTERLASITFKFLFPVFLLLNGDYFKCRKSLKYLFKALEIRERILGKYHPDTAASFTSIGLVYRKIGNLTKAFEYLFEAMIIDEKTIGIDDYRTSIDYTNIGSLYKDQKQYQMALEYYSKAAKIDEKILGIDHPYTAMDYAKIGMVYKEQHRYNNALTYFDMALIIFLKRLGPTHPDSQSVQSMIDGTKYEKDIVEALMKIKKSKEKTFWQRLFGK